MKEIWQRLQQPRVRDLAWACFSPPMLNSNQLGDPAIGNCTLALTPAREQRLLQLDKDPAALDTALAQRPSTRLGLYFEALWHFFMATDESVDLVAHNLPIRSGGKTLGEFDIIYWCHQRNQHIHLELALKYYLGLPAENLWLGPNQRDQLDNKVRHLVERQIKLGEKPESAAALEQLGVKELHREIEVKGYLFESITGPALRPAGHNADNCLRDWLTVDQFVSNCDGSSRWLLLDRQQWLAPVLSRPESLLTAQLLAIGVEQLFADGRGPVMLARCNEQGEEQQRCFVTPLGWPGSAPDHNA